MITFRKILKIYSLGIIFLGISYSVPCPILFYVLTFSDI